VAPSDADTERETRRREARREQLEAEMARLQRVLDADALGNPADPEESWAVYAMLDWGRDVYRVERVVHGSVAERLFTALPELAHTPEPPPEPPLEPPENDM
jgi:hypothetical protein